MGDASEHPVERKAAGRTPADDADPWAAACAEDLAAERERREGIYGPERPDPTEELRRLADALTEGLGALGSRLPQVGLLAKPLAQQARAAIDPVIDRNAEAINHLASAGQELLAAYRAAVLGQEARWSRPEGPGDGAGSGTPRAEPSVERADGPAEAASAGDEGERRGNRDEGDDSAGSGGAHRIDLD